MSRPPKPVRRRAASQPAEDIGGGWFLRRTRWNTWTEYSVYLLNPHTGMAHFASGFQQFCRKRDALQYVESFKAVTP